MSFIRNTELISQVGFGFHLIVQVCMKTGVYFIQRNKCQPCAATVKVSRVCRIPSLRNVVSAQIFMAAQRLVAEISLLNLFRSLI